MSDLMEYKCPCCGGGIAFDASLQKLKCPYCDTEFEVDTLKLYDDELKNDNTDETVWKKETNDEWTEDELTGLKKYSCNSCGAEIIADETLASTKCPYCDNPIMMVGQFSKDLRPDYIIPFQKTKEKS